MIKLNNINDVSKKECTGCMCCQNVCPKNCIKKVTDEEGFVFPQIDTNKCIGCSLCLKKCQIFSEPERNTPIRTLAIQIKDENSLKNSASGGVAYEICKSAILAGGVAYGAVFNENFEVFHERAASCKDLIKQQGSKYVQSDISRIYKPLKKDCESGIMVVVVGTPCQIAAIKKYLNKDYENLLLIDLICHGVPNQNLFSSYLEYKKMKMNDGKIKDYQFRCKNRGWGTTYKIKTENKQQLGNAMQETYYSDFVEALNYRESCYNCHYATIERIGDITIGDFWGINKKKNINFDYTKGVSCVLINNSKGQKFIDTILSKCFFVETSLDEIKKENSNLVAPAKRPKIRNEYYIKINKEGINFSKKLLFKKKSYYKSLLKEMVPSSVKKIIKRRMLKK